jgi:solute:Na+ symporter, SSS family
MQRVNTSFVDLLVLVIYMGITVAIGFWVGRGQKDVSSYMLGDRGIPWWAILGSIVATETSTATFLSIPGVGFNTNMTYLQLAIGYILGRILVATVILPLYFRGKLFTAYQVLAERFGGATRWCSSIIFLITRNLGDGLRLYLTAVVLQQLTGLSLEFSIILIGAVTIVYTVYGGMKSVVWNDCIQLLVYTLGGLAALLVIIQRLPEGFTQIQQFGMEHHKFQMLDMALDFKIPLTLWGGIIGGIFLTLGTHGTDQMMVQRFLSARSQREAGRAVILSGLIVFAQFALFLYLGIALATYYDHFPPDVAFTKSDRVFATFIVKDMPVGVGLVGLLLAAVFSAAMSTLSSSLNSSASSATNDIFLPLRQKNPPTDKQLLRVSKLLTILFGCVQMVLASVASSWQQSVVDNALSIAGFSAGLLLGVFLLALFVPRAGQASALLGLLAGVAGLLYTRLYTETAWTWYALIGAATTFATGCFVAIFAGRTLTPNPSPPSSPTTNRSDFP